MRRFPAFALCCAFFLTALGAITVPVRSNAVTTGFKVSKKTTQLVVGIAADWNANTVTLRRFERSPGGKWKLVGDPFPGRLGRKGLAWGRGVNPSEPVPAAVPVKREGDLRSPVGAFSLGSIFSYSADVEHNPKADFVQVTDADLLVDDPVSPMYNTHVRLSGPAQTDWEKSQAMERVDPAHELQIFVNHNVNPAPVPGAGSLILFHVWRKAGDATTAGCTSMERAKVFELVKWIDPARHPLYVLLPQALYDDVAVPWGLPKIDQTSPPPQTSTQASSTPPVPTLTTPKKVAAARPPITASPEPPVTRKRVSSSAPKVGK